MQRNVPHNKDSSERIMKSLAAVSPVVQTAATLVGYNKMNKQANDAGAYISLMFLISQFSFVFTALPAMQAAMGHYFEGRGFSKKQYLILAAMLVLSLTTLACLDRSVPTLGKEDKDKFLMAGLFAVFGTVLNNATTATATFFYAKNKGISMEQAQDEMSERSDCNIM